MSRTNVTDRRFNVRVARQNVCDGLRHCLRDLRDLESVSLQLGISSFNAKRSKLTRLLRFHFSRIGISHSFVPAATRGLRGVTVYQTVTGLSRNVGFDLMTRNVRRPSRHSLVLSLGCRCNRKCLFTGPVPPRTLAALLRANAYLSPR